MLSIVIFLMASLPIATRAQAPKDTIWAGQKLNTGILSPRTDTIDGYRIVNGQRTKTFTSLEQIERTSDGFLLRSVVGIGSSNGTTTYTTTVRDRTFAPIHSTTRAPKDSADFTYDGTGVHGWIASPTQPMTTVARDFAKDRYPLSNNHTILGVLPLRDGYAAVLASFDIGNGTPTYLSLRVLRSEPVEYHGRNIDCWVVDENTGDSRPGHQYWVAKDGGRILKTRNMRVFPDGAEVWSFLR